MRLPIGRTAQPAVTAGGTAIESGRQGPSTPAFSPAAAPAASPRGAEISQDDEVIALAVRLMALVDSAAARAGSYVVDAAGAQGMQVGGRNTHHNRFG